MAAGTRRPLMAGLLILLSLLVVSSSVEQPHHHVILPLGDSITSSGFGRFSYRYFLWQSLIQNYGDDTASSFDFVGTLRDNYNGNPEWPPIGDQEFDRDHEGHWGWRVDQVLDDIEAWMDVYEAAPTVALVHLGTNDCGRGKSAGTILEELMQLVDKLLVRNAGMTIFLAQIIPSTSRQDCAEALNQGMPSFFAESERVQVVDMATGFDAEEDTWDGLHPNDQGCRKMAAVWFGAMSESLLVAAPGDGSVSPSDSFSAPSTAPSLFTPTAASSPSWHPAPSTAPSLVTPTATSSLSWHIAPSTAPSLVTTTTNSSPTWRTAPPMTPSLVTPTTSSPSWHTAPSMTPSLVTPTTSSPTYWRTAPSMTPNLVTPTTSSSSRPLVYFFALLLNVVLFMMKLLMN